MTSRAIWTHSLAAGSIWILLILAHFPISSLIEIGGDEGMELSKAMIVYNSGGFPSEMWNDQPVTLTNLYVLTFHLFGPTTFGPRLVGVLTSAMLITSIAAMTGALAGSRVALYGSVVFIGGSHVFQSLSASAMQEVPGAAFAVAGLAVLIVCKSITWKQIVGAAALLSFAAAIKLTMVMYAPAAVLIIAAKKWMLLQKEGAGIWDWRQNKDVILQAATLAGLTALFLVGVLFIQGGLNFDQLLGAHLRSAARGDSIWSLPGDELLAKLAYFEGVILGPIALAVFAGTFIRQDPARFTMTVAPLLGVLAFNLSIRPWWGFYAIHLWISLAPIVGSVLALAWQWASNLDALMTRGRAVSGLCVAAFALMIAILFGAILVEAKRSMNIPKAYERRELSNLVQRLGRYATPGEYIYAQPAMYAFHSRLSVPPELAVVSQKRVMIGDIDPERIVEVFRKYDCKVAVFRKEQDPLEEVVAREFVCVGNFSGSRLYVAPERNPTVEAQKPW